jgi:arylsulfatase A-like enzyme
MLVRDFVKERASVAKLPPAAQNAPNVLLITMDTVRAENLSLYGYERDTTPQLKKLAKDGVVFEQAIAPSSWTLPSHAGIFTGMSPNELSFGWNRPLKPSNLTLAEALGQKGYESAGFAANLLFCTKEIGIGRGMIHYEDYPVSAGQTLLSASLGRVISNSALMRRLTGYNDSLTRKNAETINDDFLRWLSSRGQNRPFFAFLNYFDAHEPLLPPAPFSERFGPAEIGQELFYQTNGIDIKYNKKHDWSEREALKYRNAYDNSIVYLDQKLGELFAELSERGILENTVVIVTSDHGELLGERGLYGHGSSLYAETLRVPLLIRFPPRMPKDARVRNLVGLLDLPATVLDLTGDENQTAFPGSSLRRFFDERPVGSNEAAPAMIFSELRDAFVPSWYPGSKGDMQSLMTEQYHYIHNGDGKEELYDRKADPKELNDLAKSAEAQKVLEEFRNDLKKYPSP